MKDVFENKNRICEIISALVEELIEWDEDSANELCRSIMTEEEMRVFGIDEMFDESEDDENEEGEE